jgi:hypothetical protein
MSMESAGQMPVLEFFRAGTVPREIKLLTARGGVTLRGGEQLAILVLLMSDGDQEIAATAGATLGGIAPMDFAVMLGGEAVPDELQAYFSRRGVVLPSYTPPADGPAIAELDANGADGDEGPDRRPVSVLPIAERFKLAVFGSREQRAQLVRDPNKLVAMAVLSSPRLSEPEVENIARMTSVVEDVLRAISANRRWMRNYKVMSAIARNPKTPPGMAIRLLPYLHPRDITVMSVDRNLPEVVRLAARKLLAKGKGS